MCMISIHALREEGDLNGRHTPLLIMVFLSTPSARRATGAVQPRAMHRPISIHALREEGDASSTTLGAAAGRISIHALREEGDVVRDGPMLFCRKFLSTPSARRATASSCKLLPYFIISIHALREEGDAPVCRHTIAVLDFYPRPPRGGRLSAHFRGLE